MLKTNKILLAAFLLCFSLVTIAQNTNSPYSRYGYGSLTDNGVGISRSMGGLSYGLRRSNSINPGNPASYSKIDSLTFLFEIGIDYNKARLSDGLGSEMRDNGGLDYITMMMPLSKRVGFSFGVIPFSSVGYRLGGTNTQDGVTYIKQFEGSGGFSQVYGGVSYAPFWNVSVGANVSYIFGSLNHSRTLPVTSHEAYSAYSVNDFKLNGLKVDIGVQYEIPFSRNRSLTLGAVYSPAMNNKGKYTQYDYMLNTSTSTIESGDTISLGGVNAGIPHSFGGGFTFSNNQNWMFGADVTYQLWSKVKYDNILEDDLSNDDRFNDRFRVNVGGEYSPNPFDRNYFQRMKYRAGFNISNSYMNAQNSDRWVGGYTEYGATIGFGFPFRDMNFTGRTSYINLSLEYKHRDPRIPNMVKEQYFGVSLSVNINDLWFVKSKFR